MVKGMLSRCNCPVRKDGTRCGNVRPDAIGIPSEIGGVFDSDGIPRIALVVQEPWRAYNSVEIGARAISAVGDGEQFKSAFLLFESKTVNSPEDPTFAERSRDECSQRGYCLGNPERRESPLRRYRNQVRCRTVVLLSLVRLRLTERTGLAST
jgi:hypothetical protein